MTAGGHSPRRRVRRTSAYDQALKLLGERWAPQLAALLVPEAHLAGPLPGELPATERRADWLWRAWMRGTPCVLHVEFQLRGRSDMAHRMFVYASRIAAQYVVPPIGVLVYLASVRTMAEPRYRLDLPDMDILGYNFQVIRLWEWDPGPILAGELPGLVPLVPLMRGAQVEQLPELAERVLELPGLDALQRGDLVSMLATFGGLRFPSVDMWDLLRRSTMLSEVIDDLIEDSPFLRQIRDEAAARAREQGVAEGREQGVAEGREQGIAEGRLLDARALVRDVALARFADLTPADLQPLESIAAVEALHALARALVAAADAPAARRAIAEAGR